MHLRCIAEAFIFFAVLGFRALCSWFHCLLFFRPQPRVLLCCFPRVAVANCSRSAVWRLPPTLALFRVLSTQEGAPRIQAEGASEHKGDLAREAIIVGALAVSDLVKTTLGPKGMDKILQSASSPDGAITITNDGATILKSVAVDNAAAKILIEIAQVQDREVGDGTTSVCVLAGELLRQAERLLAQKLHPQTIIDGWREATNVAHDALQAATIDHGNDEKALRTDLMNIARTTLSSKVLSDHKDFFANMAVDAVLRLKGKIDLEAIHIVKKPGGSLRDSFLDEGFILDKQIGVRQPKRIENARILVANTPMDTDKVKIYGMQVKTDSVEKVAALEKAEKAKMENKCERILAHNINVFVNRQLIYNQAEQIFAKNGVMAIEHADFDGIERLALVTGGDIVSTFDSPDKVRLGECKLIEEIMIGEDRLIHFSGVALGEACTVVLRGASMHILDEAERSLHDALCVVSQAVHETRTTFGGGCAESIMAKAVDELAAKTSGKKQLAMEAFARALRQLPSIIADNAGFDATQLVSELRAAHSQGQSTAGIDLDKGEIGDMQSLGITESFKVKQQVLLSAAEAAEMVLRVDDLIRCAPRQREDMHH